ncbi:hypothetical protein YC2023_107486 [Brassica napus]
MLSFEPKDPPITQHTGPRPKHINTTDVGRDTRVKEASCIPRGSTNALGSTHVAPNIYSATKLEFQFLRQMITNDAGKLMESDLHQIFLSQMVGNTNNVEAILAALPVGMWTQTNKELFSNGFVKLLKEQQADAGNNHSLRAGIRRIRSSRALSSFQRKQSNMLGQFIVQPTNMRFRIYVTYAETSLCHLLALRILFNFLCSPKSHLKMLSVMLPSTLSKPINLRFLTLVQGFHRRSPKSYRGDNEGYIAD